MAAVTQAVLNGHTGNNMRLEYYLPMRTNQYTGCPKKNPPVKLRSIVMATIARSL